MLNETALIAALIAVVVGGAACWSNPGRLISRLFLSLSVHVGLWLASFHLILTSEDGLLWLRIASVIGALLPLHLWVTREVVAQPERSPFEGKAWISWALVTVVLGWLPFTALFIPPGSTSERPLYGIGYYLYLAGLGVAGVAMVAGTLRRARGLTGVRRLELQLLLLGGSATVMSVAGTIAAGALTGSAQIVRLAPLFVTLFYAGTAWAMTTTRVFDARHLLLITVERVLLVGIVMVAGWAVHQLFLEILPDPLAYAITVGLALWFASVLNPWLQVALTLDAKSSRDVRKATFDVARKESRLERLEQAFTTLLKGWGKSERAVILFGDKGRLKGSGIDIPADGTPMKALRELRWATPERLARERSTVERARLLDFIHEHGLGAMVASGSGTVTVVVGVGVPASRRPFTYPEITELIELTSIIENALARAHFSVKAQHAEQLATVGLLGASLAHEIRNPLVSIKTFVQLLPHHYQDQAFRDKFFRLIGDEVNRIDRLTEQLLDLAAPRAYSPAVVPLHPVLRSSLELVAGKAAEKSIRLESAFEADPDLAFTDPNAAKQVLLNLCFNAIQAIEERAGDRWVKVATRNTAAGFELSVADNGPGIAPEIRARLFQPFQSTKSSGFGLGLAICNDIVSGLNATITLDPPAPGVGAVFRVVFPCQPPTY